MKKLISLVVAAVLLLSLIPANLVMAATFVDFPTGWSKEAMTAAVDNGLLNGYENGEIRPTGMLTRAEFAAILARAFGAKTRADISGYSDVAASDWYYDYIAKVVKMGAMQGVSATLMHPDHNITREEVFTAVARVLVLESADYSVLSKFNDGAAVSEWAKPSVSALVQRGYVNGDDLGKVNPGANITREEFAQFMHNAIRTYITEAGTYKEVMQGIVVLRTGNVTLEGVTVTSDLVIGDGAMDEEVLIKGVTVEKRLLARGGTITIKDTTLGENVVVNNVNGITPFKNYRDEAVFEGLVEKTRASFLAKPGTGGNYRPGVTNITVYVDGVATTVPKNSKIESLSHPRDPQYAFSWIDENGTPIPAGTKLIDGMQIFSVANVYPIHFMDADGTTPFAYYKSEYDAPINFTIDNQATTELPKNDNVERLGWRLVGWETLDGTDVSALEVTEDLTVAEGITLKAVWEKVPYAVTFKNLDGSAFTDFVTDYTPNTAFDIETPYVFPENEKVHRTGYRFLGWFKRVENGGTIEYVPYDATLAVAAGMSTLVDVYADFELIEYKVVYHATFEEGYTPETTYTILNADTTPLAAFDKVIVTDDSMMMGGWVLADGTEFSGFEVTDETPEVIDLYPNLVPKPPVVVNFFRGYNTILNVKTSGTYEGGTLSEDDLPDMTRYYKTGYTESGSIASVYNGNNYTHRVEASLWYVDDTNTLVPFTTEVVLTEDTNVYILLDSLAITALVRDIPEPIRIAAYYNASTRAMDSVKDMAKAGRQQLEKAISLDMIPRYDETKAQLIEKLSNAGLIDEDLNIKVSEISLPISTFVKRNTADSMVRQFVRDTVNNEAKLDNLFSMIDVAELAGMLDVSGIIGTMTDAELADLVKTAEFKPQIVNYIVTDLTATPSKMLSFVVNYLTTDGEFRTRIVNQLLADLQDAEKNSALKTSALTYLDGLLKTEGSDLQKRFVNTMITSLSNTAPEDPLRDFVIEEIRENATIKTTIAEALIGDLAAGTASDAVVTYIKGSEELVNVICADLRSTSSVMMSTVVAEVKAAILDTTTPAGADVRKAILMSSSLSTILQETTVKDMIATMLLADTFIDKVLANTAFRDALVDAVVANDAFINALLHSTIFHDHVVDNLHHGDIKTDIETLLSGNTAFKTNILNRVKADANFKLLISEPLPGQEPTDIRGAMRTEVLNSITFSAVVPNESALYAYICGQSGVDASAFEGFITQTEVEAMLSDLYDEMYATNPGIAAIYGSATYAGADQQMFKDDLYADVTARDEILTTARSEFDAYKVEMLDAIAAGNTITDSAINQIIENKMVEYVEKYLEEDSSLNADVALVIEEILIAYVGEIVKATNVESTDEIYAIKGHLETLKNVMLHDETKQDDIAAVIREFVSTNRTMAEGIVKQNANYSLLISKLVPMVQAAGSTVYGDVEKALIDAVTDGKVSTATMSSFIAGNCEGDEMKNLITTYVSGLTKAQIATNLTNIFNTVPTAKETLKTKLLAYLPTMSNTAITGYMATAVEENRTMVEGLLLTSIGTITISDLNRYTAKFLAADSANVTLIRTELEKFIVDPAQASTLESMATTYIKEDATPQEIATEVGGFIDNIKAEFIHDNRALITEVLSAFDLSSIINETIVKAYINRLSDKNAFADSVFTEISQTAEYDTLLTSLLTKKEFEINNENLSMIIALAGAIRGLSLDAALEQTQNAALDKMISVLGKDRINGYFVEIRDDYCVGLDAAIARVQSTHQPEKYTTSLTWKIDLINGILIPLYDKAVPKVVEKIEGLNVRYNENIYLKYLVEDDAIEHFITYNASKRSETLTGYQLKDNILEYYDYLYMLLLVGDDALCWYGDDNNVSPEGFAAVYTALFAKGDYVYERLRELAEAFEEDGTLPDRVDSLVSQVKQISDLLSANQAKLQGLVARYLGSSVDELITSGELAENEKVQKLADWLVGQEEPVITIDSLYELFYQYDENVQEKLQELIDSGKLRAAVDKFESTSIGELFKGNGRFGTLADRLEEIKNSGRVTGTVDSVYDLLCIVAEEGIEPFRVLETKDDIATRDDYEFSVAGVTLRITRKLEF